MLKFKEGQTYICTKTDTVWWTVGKEYNVFYDDRLQSLAINDNLGTTWFDYELNSSYEEFILKEEKELEEKQEEINKSVEDMEHLEPYDKQDIQPIDIMRRNFTPEEYCGFLQGNILECILLYKHKNGVEDLAKAQVYIGLLLEYYKG